MRFRTNGSRRTTAPDTAPSTAAIAHEGGLLPPSCVAQLACETWVYDAVRTTQAMPATKKGSA